MGAETRNYLFVAVVFTVTVIMTGCSDPEHVGAGDSAAGEVAQLNEPPQAGHAVPAGGGEGIAGLPPSALLHYYGCKSDQSSCSRDPLVAESPEEAQWLRARGYPTPDQIKTSLAKSAEALRIEAERSGSVVDKSLYGHALLRDGKYKEAVGAMADSFMNEGNIYGLYLTSEAYMDSEELMNPPLAMAFLRLAYLAGDSKAGGAFEEKFTQVTPPERVFADRRAADLRRKMAPEGSWPRP